jgi:hypothetical protein
LLYRWRQSGQRQTPIHRKTYMPPIRSERDLGFLRDISYNAFDSPAA